MVVSDDGHEVVVILDDDSAGECAGCGIAFACRRDKCRRLTVRHSGAGRYEPGAQVVVSAEKSLKKAALLLFFVIPLILMALVAVALDACDVEQGWSALAAVGALALWYLILYLFRRRIELMYQWRIVS